MDGNTKGVEGGSTSDEDEEEEVDDEEGKAEGTSGTVKLKPWSQRKYAGLESAGLTSPLIDKVHRLMHLWRAGDVLKVDEYLDRYGLGYNTLFGQLLQALIELAPAQSEERALLESISNHVAERSGVQTNRLRWTE
jgi:putative DNA methylase